MNNSELLILIDGSSYLYRAFHALPPLTNSHGEPTGAIYGVLNMIRKLLQDYQPTYVAVIFDPKGKTHRDQIYPYYKANRPPAPDELQAQIKPLHDIIGAMGLPLIMIEGEEADDVIGTLTKRAQAQHIKVLISTGDKDMAQLVNPQVSLINTMSNTYLDEAGVEQKFGVKPNQIIDYLALIGDTSDNIPGVPKVGPKTAAKWLLEYGDLDQIIQQHEKISGKVGENLKQSLPQLPLAKQLVTIRSELDLPFTMTDLKPQPKQREQLIEWFRRLEFRSWLDELLHEGKAPEYSKKNYDIVTLEDQFEGLLEELETSKIFAFDTETTSLNPLTAELVGISVTTKQHHGYYIPVGYPNLEQLNREWVLKKLKPILANSDMTIIGQNLKYDMSVLAKYGVSIEAKIYDTMLESYILNSASSRHDKATLALRFLGQRIVEYEDIAGKGSKQIPFVEIPLGKAAAYACQDADITLQLHETLWAKYQNDEKLKKVLTEIELPLVPVLTQMELTGILVERSKLQVLSLEFGERINRLEQNAHQIAGKIFNLSSPKQLQEVLYQDLKIPATKKTPTGQPSTSEEVLQELAGQYELPKLILEHRTLCKLKSTYIDALMMQADPFTGRVHTCYNQAVTSTGRLSSTDPNLQNIPIRTQEGKRIRQTFIAPPGYKIISADYSQIELRIMAYLSQDQNLLNAFLNGKDIHTATAAEVFGIALDQVTPNQRRDAKAINFGLIYGMSSFGLAQNLGIDTHTAQQYMNLYFERYPAVKAYMENTRTQAHRLGFVETYFGRRLYLPEINVSNLMRRRAAERAAINAPMQGTAADIIKLAMIKLHDCIQKNSLDLKMLLQVHDELVFEVAEKDLTAAAELINDCMVNIPNLPIPLAVEVGMGANWDEAH